MLKGDIKNPNAEYEHLGTQTENPMAKTRNTTTITLPLSTERDQTSSSSRIVSAPSATLRETSPPSTCDVTSLEISLPFLQSQTLQHLAFQDAYIHSLTSSYSSDSTQRNTVLRSAPAANINQLAVAKQELSDTNEQSEIELEIEAEAHPPECPEKDVLRKYYNPSINFRASKKRRTRDEEPLQAFYGCLDKPSTSRVNENILEPQRKYPPCAVCGDPSTGIHFGADSCAACSAFFRRTVAVKRNFQCFIDGPSHCPNLKGSSSCKKCRFEKCLSAGMDIDSVQCYRDSIGNYSKKAKVLRNGNILSGGHNILDDLVENFRALNYRRHLLYSIEKPIEEIFDGSESPILEMKCVSGCFYQMRHTETRLAADFVRSLHFLKDNHLPVKELLLLYQNFDVTRQAVEEPFLTYEHKLLDKNCWVMLNRNYIDLSSTEKYFEDGTMKELNLNRQTAENLFIPSLRNAMANVSTRMRKHQITKTEMIALYGISLFDTGVKELSNETRDKMLLARGLISKSLLQHYQDVCIDDPEIRLGTLYMDIYTYSKVHAITTSENNHLLDIFDIVPVNKDRIMEKWWKNEAAAGCSTKTNIEHIQQIP